MYSTHGGHHSSDASRWSAHATSPAAPASAYEVEQRFREYEKCVGSPEWREANGDASWNLLGTVAGVFALVAVIVAGYSGAQAGGPPQGPTAQQVKDSDGRW